MKTTILALLMLFGSTWAQAASVCIKNDCLEVQVVTKKDQMKRGLQGRNELASDQGMLFVFDQDDTHRFWMKDMKMSIDMIWLNQDGVIVTIAPSRRPCTIEPCEVYEPSSKARYVLEVADGVAAQHQLKIGDTLQLKDIE